MEKNSCYINLEGERLEKESYLLADRFYEDYALIRFDDGYTHKNINLTVKESRYKWLTRFFYGYAAYIKFDGQTGFVDYNHTERIIVSFDGFSRFSADGVAVISKNGKFGIITTEGNVKWLKDDYSLIAPFEEGMALVELNQKYGFINLDGELILPAVWDSALSFGNGITVVSSGGKDGYINQQGEIVIPIKHKALGVLSEGRIDFLKGRKYGYLDEKGDIAIPPIFEQAETFANGLAPVRLNKKWGFINLDGEMVVEPVFDHATRVTNGYSCIYYKDQPGLMDEKGNTRFYPDYKMVDFPYKGIISARQEDRQKKVTILRMPRLSDW